MAGVAAIPAHESGAPRAAARQTRKSLIVRGNSFFRQGARASARALRNIAAHKSTVALAGSHVDVQFDLPSNPEVIYLPARRARKSRRSDRHRP
jgi:hypothetical protein